MTERLEFVQGLRGIAAASIVLYHARVFIDGPRYLDIGSRLFGSGGAGVDLFFVISGLIMVHTTRDLEGTPRDAAAFLARRFARIWPVYVIAFFVAWKVWAMTTPPVTTDWASVAKTLAFVPLSPEGAAPFFGYPLLHVGWTLVYEAFFYLIFAISLATGRWRWIVLAAMFIGGLVVWPWLATGGVHGDAMRSYGLRGYACIATSPILWDFAFGVVIGAVFHGSRWTFRDRGLLLCFSALTTAVVVWQQLSQFRLGHGPTRWGVPIAMMVLALTLQDKAHRIVVPSALRWLGDISYSLYMFHVLPQLMPRVFVAQPELMTGGGFFVVSIVVGVILAYLSHRWLERGLSERLRRWLLDCLSPRDSE